MSIPILDPLIHLFCQKSGLCESDQAKLAPEPAAPKDNSPANAGRVRIFEGITHTRLKNMLAGYPVDAATQKNLDDIFTQDPAGKPDSIDRGTEAQNLAEELQAANHFLWKGKSPLFFKIRSKDIQLYKQQEEVEAWKARGDESFNELGIGKVNHPLAQVARDLGVTHFHNFRSLPAFDRLAQTIANELPAVKISRHLEVLYPASGFHIAPLLTAFRLMDQNLIDTASYTYTEIDKSAFGELCSYAEVLVNKGVCDSFSLKTPKIFGPYGSEGKEYKLELVYKGKTICFTLALNRSGREYYRGEYLPQADIVVIHDPGNNSLKLSYELLSQMLFEKSRGDDVFKAKPQLVIMEGEQDPGYFAPSIDRKATPPAGTSFIPLLGPYGHCDGVPVLGEITGCEFQSAFVYKLHDPALMAEAEKSDSATSLAGKIYQETLTGIQFCGSPPGFDDE